MSARVKWSYVLKIAREIVEQYDTGVTLRQLFYRLVAAEVIPNTRNYYQTLSSYTAEARRQGTFPDLIDRTRLIHRPQTFTTPAEAREWLANIYRRDRTEGQSERVYIGVEKNGMLELLRAWFWDYGMPIIALGGYSSQSFVDAIAEDIINDGRPSVFIYAGDFDPSGEDIQRDFVRRTGVFDHVQRIALTLDQVQEYDLPPALGKDTDTRAQRFVSKYGQLMQVELDALEPTTLRRLYMEAIAEHFDVSEWENSVERERADREALVSA